MKTRSIDCRNLLFEIAQEILLEHFFFLSSCIFRRNWDFFSLSPWSEFLWLRTCFSPLLTKSFLLHLCFYIRVLYLYSGWWVSRHSTDFKFGWQIWRFNPSQVTTKGRGPSLSRSVILNLTSLSHSVILKSSGQMLECGFPYSQGRVYHMCGAYFSVVLQACLTPWFKKFST